MIHDKKLQKFTNQKRKQQQQKPAKKNTQQQHRYFFSVVIAPKNVESNILTVNRIELKTVYCS